MTIGSALLSVLLIALEAFGKILRPSLVPTQMSSFYLSLLKQFQKLPIHF